MIPTPTPSSSTSLCTDTVGNSDISVGSHVSCPFAKNVLIAAARYYQSNGHLPDGVSLSVSSPTTGGTYMVAYSVSSDGGTIYAYNTESSSFRWQRHHVLKLPGERYWPQLAPSARSLTDRTGADQRAPALTVRPGATRSIHPTGSRIEVFLS